MGAATPSVSQLFFEKTRKKVLTYTGVYVNIALEGKEGSIEPFGLEAYVKENAEKVFPPREIDGEFGIKCTFLAQSQDQYGTGLFRFVEVHR